MLNIIRLKAYKKLRELEAAEKSAGLELEKLKREEDPERQSRKQASKAKLASEAAELRAMFGAAMAAIGGVLLICLRVFLSRAARQIELPDITPFLPEVNPVMILVTALLVVFGIGVVFVIVNARRIWDERGR
jgi:hypothetical protein